MPLTDFASGKVPIWQMMGGVNMVPLGRTTKGRISTK